MPAQAPSSFDPSIPLQVKGPLDNLGGIGGALGFAAKRQLGQLASQSVGPDGQIDYDRFLGLVMQNPLTAGFAGQEISQLRQAQLSQAQLATEQQKQMGTFYGQIARAALAARDPGTFSTFLSSTIASAPPYVRQQAGPMVNDLVNGLTSGIGVDQNGQLTPQGAAIWNSRRQQLAALTGANADTRFAAFAPGSVVQSGWGDMAAASKQVTGQPTPGGQPTAITAAQFAATQNGAQPNALGANVSPTNTLAPSGVGMPTEISPSTKQLMTTLGTQFSDEDKKAYDNAQLLLGNVAEMRSDLTKLTDNPNIMTLTGPGASARLDAAKTWNLAMQGLGVKDSKYMVDTNQVGSMEDLIKQANRAAFAYMSSVMGVQREGWQTVARAAKSVPGAENSPVGLNYIMNSLEETANWKSAQRYYELNYLQNPNNKGLIGAEEAFNKQYPIQAFIDRGMSKTQDPLTGKYVSAIKVKSPDDLKQYLPGTVVQLPDGKMVTVTQKYSGFAPLPQPGQ